MTRDPFADPIRQDNPLRVAACGGTLPRQTSWYIATKVRTVRLGLLRYANDDGTQPAMGNSSDDAVKKTAVTLALYLSELYRPLGMRFVFDPAHDFLRLNDTVANLQKRETGTTGADINNRIQSAAGRDLDGRLVISIAVGMQGGASWGDPVEYEASRKVDPVTQASIAKSNPKIPQDKAGLQIVNQYVGESRITTEVGNTHHEAHEIGHYLGLHHTFEPDQFDDTPDDIVDGKPLLQLGAVMCGNVGAIEINGKRVAPDKLNNESYWGCNLGRSYNSFSPLQLAKMNWELDTYLNRYPLVACQPVKDYNASDVACENEESLTRCRETAAYLKTSGGVLDCRPGGRFTDAIAAMLQSPAVRFVFEKTATGRGLLNRLGGLVSDTPLSPQKRTAVMQALVAGKNLPLTMAVVNRIREIQDMAGQKSPTLAASFTASGEQPSGGDQRILTQIAGQAVTPEFIAHVPSIVPR